ncbi:hypothetical protein AMECASPLE_036236 [Ameca splendens]|uniref:Uncharacterized protein n=1 Tax=Ameca splendens TaxID=208324 RepID=A0ABV1A2Y4_9TELE
MYASDIYLKLRVLTGKKVPLKKHLSWSRGSFFFPNKNDDVNRLHLMMEIFTGFPQEVRTTPANSPEISEAQGSRDACGFLSVWPKIAENRGVLSNIQVIKKN